ncbi:MAG: M20/M25/M40 family metallo-hydrolase [Erysipelotrichaceae bacterium]|nr:M20/M25/M40 family metallo-hydrolase [Erysipelotrichaceae bacterium]
MSESAILHLQRAIQCKTISYKERSLMDFSEFEKFIENIRLDYPTIFASGQIERFVGYSLLIKLPGKSDLPPIGLMGHFDVVPVREDNWIEPPFSGVIRDGYVYGRGTLDMKGHVISMLEAVESLLSEGFEFERDVYIMLGHNEETGSILPDSGATAIRDYLKQQGVFFSMVVDEGGALINGKSLGIDGTVALIGVGEKGYLDIELTATQSGGHASMPPKKSAMAQVFEAASKLERDKFPANFNNATNAMFDALIPQMKQPLKFLFSNRNIFKPILLKVMTDKPDTAAVLRTTCVATMASGSFAPNVLAQKATVVCNVRIIPGESIESVRSRVLTMVGSEIEVKLLNGTEPTDISPSNIREFEIIQETTIEHYPHFKAVAPYLMVAATDSRVYHGMAKGVYRIAPFEISGEDMKTVHADNERVLIENYLKGIEFFKSLIRNASQS